VPAVCCAKTICSGMIGTHAVTISIVPKMLYSASETFFASRCTPKAITPAMMFAIISQPLWRKNAACGLWSTVGIALSFSADIGAQRLPDEIGGEKAIQFKIVLALVFVIEE
jgi:hypothetical protein